jgi:hypothetical protein
VCVLTNTFSACGAKNFKLPGSYILRLAVYDCVEVEKVLDRCDAVYTKRRGLTRSNLLVVWRKLSQ